MGKLDHSKPDQQTRIFAHHEAGENGMGRNDLQLPATSNHTLTGFCRKRVSRRKDVLVIWLNNGERLHLFISLANVNLKKTNIRRFKQSHWFG